MSGVAKVESLDALRQFRASLIKFAATVRSAMGEADADTRRVTAWVQDEQRVHWSRMNSRCADQVTQAAATLRQKKLFPSVIGSRPDCAEEEKALKLAKARLEHTETRIEAVKRWSRQLPRETLLYAGQTRAMMQVIEADVPRALVALEQMSAALDAYLRKDSAPAEATCDTSTTSMARPDTPPEKATADQPKTDSTEASDEPARGPGETE